MLELTKYFATSECQKLLFDVEFWGKVLISQVNAIVECSASNHKEVEKMVKRYRQKKKEIIHFVGSGDIFEGDEAISFHKRLEASRLLQLIAIHFLAEMPKLIKSSWGESVQSINHGL